MSTKTHFIALVPMGGKFTGKIGQHSTMQANIKDAKEWAAGRFTGDIVVVPADGVNSFDTDTALSKYLEVNNGSGYLKGLSLPLRYEGGVILDGAGKIIIEANRNSLETSLGPAGRDAILKLTCDLLNEAFEYDKAAVILRKLGY